MANEHIFKSGVVVSGSIESTTGFVGDGTGLTGITSTTIWNGKLDGDSSITGSITVSGSTARVDFVETAGVTGSFSGSFKGNGSDLTNININGTTASNVTLSGSFTGNGSGLTGLEPFPYYGDAKVTGSLTVSSSLVDFTDSIAISGSIFSGSFVGDGTGLSGLTASPAGTNTQIQYNNNGVTGASSGLRYSIDVMTVSSSIQMYDTTKGAFRISQSDLNISQLQARGYGGTNMGTFLFQGRTPYGTTSDYLTVSSAEVDAQLALIKGGRLSVGGYPTTTPTAAQGNLFVKRNTSSNGASADTVATFINSDVSSYGGGGFIDIIGNSNDYASGGIRVKNGIHTDGEIYYAAGTRSIILEANKRTGSSSGGFVYKWQGSTKFLINAAGDVGIGTTTPSQKLDVQGKIVAKDKILINGSDLDMASLESTAGHKIARVDVQDGIYDYGNQAMYINSGKVGIGTASPSSSAILDVSSTTKGVLLPRLTINQITSISSPATGLTVYNTSLNTLCFYNGTHWRVVSSAVMIVPE